MDQSRESRDQEQSVQAAIEHAVGIASRESTLPHIVVYASPCGGGLSFSGPYQSGLDALLAVERELSLETPGERPESFRVAPLYPPLDLFSDDT